MIDCDELTSAVVPDTEPTPAEKALQQMIDFANETKDLEDEVLDAQRVHQGKTLAQYLAGE